MSKSAPWHSSQHSRRSSSSQTRNLPILSRKKAGEKMRCSTLSFNQSSRVTTNAAVLDAVALDPSTVFGMRDNDGRVTMLLKRLTEGDIRLDVTTRADGKTVDSHRRDTKSVTKRLTIHIDHLGEIGEHSAQRRALRCLHCATVSRMQSSWCCHCFFGCRAN